MDVNHYIFALFPLSIFSRNLLEGLKMFQFGDVIMWGASMARWFEIKIITNSHAFAIKMEGSNERPCHAFEQLWTNTLPYI